MSFVNLYFKTEYSLLQSACSIKKSFQLLSKYGYDSVAITDEGVMSGVIKFYKEAKNYNIKPIIGLKLEYQYNGITSQILLYAMNTFGYRNLMRLSSMYMINNKKIDLMDILNLNIGILGIIPFSESIFLSDYKKQRYKELFEHLNLIKQSIDQLYIGLSMQTKEDKEIIDDVIEMFEGHSYKMVALSKVSFLNEEDIDAYQTLRSIEKGGQLHEISEREYSEYLFKPEEIDIIFRSYPKLIQTTTEIKEKCNVEFSFDKYYLPRFSEEIDANSYLASLAKAGLKKRMRDVTGIDLKPYVERLKYELDTIKEMGFSDYFLIVWDFIKFAKTNGIYVGPGRGSAAASLVGYSLGITEIDPIKYNLLFERFLNKERISMPDIDTDFPDDSRSKVIEYVGMKYTKNRVAHIATFGTFKVKLALRDASRVHKLSDVRLKEVLSIIEKLELKELYSKTLEQIINESTKLQQLMEDFDDIAKVLKIAKKIEGLPRNVSTHAAGIIITKHDLVNYTPVDAGLDGIYQTQLEASDLESLGLLKMDVRLVRL